MMSYKFRSYSKSRGMLYASLDKNSFIDAMVLVFRNGKVMQYTGLKDRDGKEIYEGDILKIDNKDIDAVRYQHGAFKVLDGMVFNFIDVKVIGNIYQNPNYNLST